jgi:DNA-binding response OmpR family regulator
MGRNIRSRKLSTSAPNLETVLVVDDDPRMQRVLKRIFLAEGYQVITSPDGLHAVASFESNAPAAVVLDLMLPGLSGREVCKRFKASSPSTPVVVVSAVTDVSDKVLLLELGADDYVTKPFSPRELFARVQAALRRSRKQAFAEVTKFGECEVDFPRMTLHRNGQPVPLTAHEFQLLRFFLEHPERVLSREELLNHVWGYNFFPTTRTVDNQVMKLRQKLEREPSSPSHFVTVHGAGYKFSPGR